MNRTKKAAFAIWYTALIIVAVDAILEHGYPKSSYSPGPGFQIAAETSFALILVTAIPLALYFWKRNIGRKATVVFLAVFLASTFLLTVTLAPYAEVSAQRKAKVQWYIDDLRSHGFNVVDEGQYYYRHGGGEHRIDTYEEVISTAQSINCTTIQIHCGTPTTFLFFMGDGLQIVFWAEHSGEYLYYPPYNPDTGISLPP